MTVFVDTSALYALVVAEDGNHAAARTHFAGLLERRERLRTTDYVVVESTALLQRCHGVGAARALHERFVPLLHPLLPGGAVLDDGVSALLAADRRGVSLVDWTSFAAMRRERIDRAFAFDGDFAAQGFAVVDDPDSVETRDEDEDTRAGRGGDG